MDENNSLIGSLTLKTIHVRNPSENLVPEQTLQVEEEREGDGQLDEDWKMSHKMKIHFFYLHFF